MSSFPFPEPLRKTTFRPDAPIITSALTQSPAQEFDRSHSWPKREGGWSDPLCHWNQSQRLPFNREVRLEGLDSSYAKSDDVSPLHFNSETFFRNSLYDVGTIDGLAPPLVPLEEPRLPLMPPRPRAVQTSKSRSRNNSLRPRSKALAELKPYILQASKEAPKYVKGAPADFYPWSSERRQAEDTLNEQSISSGHYDKIHVTPNESMSARPLIWSTVKHKSGLQILSSLFTSTLKQRQLGGTITSRCTFKPPPRVTLTDTKREAWLKDLADSEIPLRRLSRTIPHGIRGKSLLDQCLLKHIPTWRAIWLVKCVGANEIRAFNRKGASCAFVAGGERKWVKDWTVQLQQFVESVIESCGTPEWRTRVMYALQLVAHVYHEQLLERDSFLDWICSSIESVKADSLPLWLLIAKMYQEELTAHRKHGRRLAVSLCARYDAVNAQGPVDALADLRNELATLMVELMQSQPECFFYPDEWDVSSDALRLCASAYSMKAEEAFRSIRERNLKLLLSVADESGNAGSTLLSQLIKILDARPLAFDFKALSAQCQAASSSSHAMVLTTLHWATSVYRYGFSRLYLAVRLLRHWCRMGATLDAPIFDFLEAASGTTAISPTYVYKLVAELVRSRHFSISKYLQWLMARGVRSAASDSPDFFSELLHNVPTNALSEHVINLRTIVFGTLQQPEGALVEAKSRIGSKLSFTAGPKLDWDALSANNIMSEMTMNDLYELSLWMRRVLFDFLSTHEDKDDKRMHDDEVRSLLQAEDFDTCCNCLKISNDYTILADILGAFIDHGPRALLNRMVDMLSLDFEIFYSIGAVEDLFSRALDRFSEIYNKENSERALLMSLLDLAGMLPGKAKVQTCLQHELCVLDQNTITTAGSPVSDYVPDASQPGDVEFLYEMDQRLSSGSNMDQPLLSRIFFDITNRLENVWLSSAKLISGFFDLLPLLRSFDQRAFDKLQQAWLDRVMITSRRPSLFDIVPHLICNGSSKLDKVLDQVTSHFGKSKSNPALAGEVLALLLYDADRLGVVHLQGHHRFLCQRHRVIRTRPALASATLTAAFAALPAQAGDLPAARSLFMEAALPELLQTVLNSSGADADQLRKTLADSGSQQIQAQAIDQALLFNPRQFSANSPADAIAAVVRMANEFNVELCQIKISNMFAGLGKNHDLAFEELAGVLEAEAQRLEGASLNVWQQLMSAFSASTLQTFQSLSTTHLMAKLPPFTLAASKTLHAPADRSVLQRLLGVTAVVTPLLTAAIRFQILPLVAEKLNSMVAYVSNLGQLNALSTNGNQQPFPYEPSVNHLRFWLHVLLQILILHRSAFTDPKVPQQTLASLVIPLSTLLAHTAIDFDPLPSEHLLDILTLLADALTSETRAECYRALHATSTPCTRDPRLAFLLGSSSSTDTGPSLVFTDPDRVAPDGRAPPDTPYVLRPWELVSNATPAVGENDACISLALFGAKRAVL